MCSVHEVTFSHSTGYSLTGISMEVLGLFRFASVGHGSHPQRFVKDESTMDISDLLNLVRRKMEREGNTKQSKWLLISKLAYDVVH